MTDPLDDAVEYLTTFRINSPEYAAVLGLIELLQRDHRLFATKVT